MDAGVFGACFPRICIPWEGLPRKFSICLSVLKQWNCNSARSHAVVVADGIVLYITAIVALPDQMLHWVNDTTGTTGHRTDPSSGKYLMHRMPCLSRT